MSVAILRQGDYLIASIQSDLSDSEVVTLRHELAELVGTTSRRAGSSSTSPPSTSSTRSSRAPCARSSSPRSLRGAETVIVGIQPDVAIAMVQFRLNLEPLRVALDLDDGEGAARSHDRGDAEDGG